MNSLPEIRGVEDISGAPKNELEHLNKKVFEELNNTKEQYP